MEYIESNSTPLEVLIKNISSRKKGNHQRRSMVKAKEKDQKVKKDFAKSKLRDWVDCDNCGSHRCIYFNNAVGKKHGRSKEYERLLLNCKEHGYFCGNNTGKEKFAIKRLLRCGNHIEMQCYNSEIITGKPTSGRALTDLICCLCYDDHHILSAGVIKRMKYVGGNNPLPIFSQ